MLEPGINGDEHEPKEIGSYVDQAVNCTISQLNINGYTDWCWLGTNGICELERKTARDLAMGADEVEDQLRNQVQRSPNSKHRLLIEGALEPSDRGVKWIQRKHGTGTIEYNVEGNQHGAYARLMGQIAGWSEFIEIIPSFSYASTAAILVELYKFDQKEEHSTFQRYFKPMIWKGDDQVRRLLGMALNDTNIGPEKAQAIINEFGTIWIALHKSVEAWTAIPGIGRQTAVNFLRKMGRGDV